MDIRLEPLSETHRDAVMAIYNHYVDHGFASYREIRLPAEAFGRFLELAKGYPAYVCIEDGGSVRGFGFLHAWHPSECFGRTAEVTYFLHPEATGRGLGTQLLERMAEEAKALGIDRILASISSRNPGSLAFHRKHRFQECGRFPAVGRKRGEDFDVVWMIRQL